MHLRQEKKSLNNPKTQVKLIISQLDRIIPPWPNIQCFNHRLPGDGLELVTPSIPTLFLSLCSNPDWLIRPNSLTSQTPEGLSWNHNCLLLLLFFFCISFWAYIRIWINSVKQNRFLFCSWLCNWVFFLLWVLKLACGIQLCFSCIGLLDNSLLVLGFGFVS